MRKQGEQGCRRKKSVEATGRQEQAKPQVNGETLRSAVAWVVNEKSFQNLNFPGNTTWLVCDWIILAVLWVWSDQATLTGACPAGRAKRLANNSRRWCCDGWR